MGCGSSKVANEGAGAYESVILPTFPDVLGDLRLRRWTLLWRGSRDGFTARDFHGRCDGHPNTVTFILDKRGNIFGGYTPIAWESRTQDVYKADPDRRSFIFTVKNPSNASPKKFSLRPDKSKSAIACEYSWGPTFGEGDIFVASNGDASESSYARYFGDVYQNDTKRSGVDFLTGSEKFTVADIEVFELDAPAPAAPSPSPAPALPEPGPLDSVIGGDFVDIFTEYSERGFVRLWRGSSDGFAPAVFHARCDGHKNTLVIIKDTNENVFGGFSAAAWESPPFGRAVTDSTQGSFLFTLVNPHEKPPERFPIRPTALDRAIWCDAHVGPAFGEDIVVFNETNAYSKFGEVYRNTTEFPATTFFAGSQCFKITEIEVHELVD